MTQCGKARNFLSLQKIFRQINSLITKKPLFSQNFCQKCVRENSNNFHTVYDWQMILCTSDQFVKCMNFSASHFLRDFIFSELEASKKKKKKRIAILPILETTEFWVVCNFEQFLRVELFNVKIHTLWNCLKTIQLGISGRKIIKFPHSEIRILTLFIFWKNVEVSYSVISQ